MTVVGATLDDLRLMQIGNVFVTGTVDPPDFDWVVRSYDLQALFITATRPIFGHPTIELAFACGLPVAYFDWSSGRLKPKKGDLALDPAVSFESHDDAAGTLDGEILKTCTRSSARPSGLQPGKSCEQRSRG